jgi:ribosome-binding protein aMBF1 (putative translation factor)
MNMATVLERDIASMDTAIFDFDRRRLEVFERLVTELEAAAGGTTDEEFGRIFAHAQTALALSDLELARLLKVSRTTIGRWARGLNTPHAVMAEAVFNVLAGAADKELRRLRRITRDKAPVAA